MQRRHELNPKSELFARRHASCSATPVPSTTHRKVPTAVAWGLMLVAAIACSTDLDNNYTSAVVACEIAADTLSDCCQTPLPEQTCEQQEAHVSEGCGTTYHERQVAAFTLNESRCVDQLSCAELEPHCDAIVAYLSTREVLCTELDDEAFGVQRCRTQTDAANERAFRSSMEALCDL